MTIHSNPLQSILISANSYYSIPINGNQFHSNLDWVLIDMEIEKACDWGRIDVNWTGISWVSFLLSTVGPGVCKLQTIFKFLFVSPHPWCYISVISFPNINFICNCWNLVKSCKQKNHRRRNIVQQLSFQQKLNENVNACK